MNNQDPLLSASPKKRSLILDMIMDYLSNWLKVRIEDKEREENGKQQK